MEFWIVFLVLIVGYFLFQVVSGYQEGSRSGSNAVSGGPPAAEWPRLGNFDFPIVGESHYQATLKKLAGNHGDRSPDVEVTARLAPEPDNRYDKNAIRVQVGGETVGYLSREDATRFRRRLGSKGLTGKVTTCRAIITGGYVKRDGARTSYGVQLDIKPFD